MRAMSSWIQHTCSFFLLAVILGSGVLAESGGCQTLPSAPLPTLRFSHGVEMSGILDAYYTWNGNHPGNHVNTDIEFDAYDSAPRLNLAEVGLSRDASPFGFEIDMGAGDTYKLVNATEPDGPLRDFLQTYESYKANRLKNVQIDVGKFQTSAGIESAETLSGWNYSRSLLFVFAQPNYHFGIRSQAPFGNHIKVGLQWVNGWNHVLDGNGWRTVAITGELNTKRWTLSQDYYYGPEKVENTFRTRGLYDCTLLGTLVPGLQMDINFDTGYQQISQGSARWHGVATSVLWKPASRIALSPRYEWFQDAKGFTTGTPQVLQEVTATGDYYLHRGLTIRSEYRFDRSDERVFAQGDRFGVDYSQPTALVSIIVSFGTLGR